MTQHVGAVDARLDPSSIPAYIGTFHHCIVRIASWPLTLSCLNNAHMTNHDDQSHR